MPTQFALILALRVIRQINAALQPSEAEFSCEVHAKFTTLGSIKRRI